MKTRARTITHVAIQIPMGHSLLGYGFLVSLNIFWCRNVSKRCPPCDSFVAAARLKNDLAL